VTALRLKDLGRWYSGGTPPRDRLEHWDGDVPWISAKDIDSTRLRPASTFITAEAACEHSRVVPTSSLLLIVRGMALAHGLPVVETDTPVAFNQDLRALVCANGIVPRFVYYSLIGHRWRLNAHIDQAAHGTARVNDTVFDERPLRVSSDAEFAGQAVSNLKSTFRQPMGRETRLPRIGVSHAIIAEALGR
jgi:type I restriction enzyme, S subunit